MITKRQMGLALPSALAAGRIDMWYGPLTDAMVKYDITTPARIQFFLANVANETGQLQARSENLHYTGERLYEVFPSLFADVDAANAVAAGGEVAIGNCIYGNRMGNVLPGDGYKYRGRGPIELTGKNEYVHFFVALGMSPASDPDLLLDPKFGALSAADYWHDNGCNAYADRNDFVGVRRLVNGGDIGMAESQAYLARFVDAMNHPDPVVAPVVQSVAVLAGGVPLIAGPASDPVVVVPPMPATVFIASVPELAMAVDPAPVPAAPKPAPVLEPVAPMSPVPPAGYTLTPSGNVIREDITDSLIIKTSKWGRLMTAMSAVSVTAGGIVSQFKTLLGDIGPTGQICLTVLAVAFGGAAYKHFSDVAKQRVEMNKRGIA